MWSKMVQNLLAETDTSVVCWIRTQLFASRIHSVTLLSPVMYIDPKGQVGDESIKY